MNSKINGKKSRKRSKQVLNRLDSGQQIKEKAKVYVVRKDELVRDAVERKKCVM